MNFFNDDFQDVGNNNSWKTTTDSIKITGKAVEKEEVVITVTTDDVWEPEFGLDHIPDDILAKARAIIDAGLLTSVKVFRNADDELKVKISYRFSACRFGAFKGLPEQTEDTNTITRFAETKIGTCNAGVCGEVRYIPAVAGYMKYAMDNGILETVLAKREAYRKEHDGEKALLFTWDARDKDKLKHLPLHMFTLAEQMIEKGLLNIRPYPSIDGRFYVDFCRIGQCAVKDSEGKFKGSEKAGPLELKKSLEQMEGPATSLSNNWVFNQDTAVFAGSISLCNCSATFCPYVVAAYILYLRLTGQEALIEEAKEYSKTHPEEVFWGANQLKYSFDDKTIEKIKASIATAPDDLLSAAFRILDNGEALLSPEIAKEDNDDTKWYRLNLLNDIGEGDTVEECLAGGSTGEKTVSYLLGAFTDFNGISVKSRLMRLVAAIDYCRREGIDIREALEKREKDMAELKDMSDKTEGLEKFYQFVQSDKTSSLSCIMQGDAGSGKMEAIQSVASILSQNGKTLTNKYRQMTLQQLSEELTTHKTVAGAYTELCGGYEFKKLDKNTLYVLTGLEEFLLFFRYYGKDPESYKTTSLALRHLVRELGTFAEDTYVIIVSPSKTATEEFLELNKKYTFTFGQNIIRFDNKPPEVLYEEYMEGLSDDVREQITDKKAHYNAFAEFITLNEKFLPFANTGLSHYLSEYSNVKKMPVFPPNIYDKKAVQNSLNNMIGMKAVKEQLADFEAYITFQKKAKAMGIKTSAGNLHMQFLGNPGTGKTTIARIVAKMLYDIGILEENKVVEVERKDLVARYTGQTAQKTSDKIKEAMGGVLFIDEAYSLYLDSQDSFGKEAIATIIKAMEDNKDRLIVIFAGYDKEMNEFLKANSGIQSRIGYTFHFEDYTEAELTEMFARSMKGQNFVLEDGVLSKVKDVCRYYRKRKNFGNGRFVKQVEQYTIINHSKNMGKDGFEIKTITADEVPAVQDLSAQSSGERVLSVTLDDIVGMQNVKKQLKEFSNRVRFEQEAKTAGIKMERGNLHMQFLGNPGTGKTTIARIVTQELFEAGIIVENKLIEVERKDLVAAYAGQTASKTSDVIERAMGGVLFIDEAYSLRLDDNDTFGKEAIATLIKAMEDHKDSLVVIFAGYSKEMNDFLKANSGIQSRIGYTFRFEDYTTPELLEMFRKSLTKQEFVLADTVEDKLKDIFDYYRKRKNFGNGRFVKRVEQAVFNNHANRINESGWDVRTITIEDIPDIRDFAVQSSGSGDNIIPLEDVIGMKLVKQQIGKFKRKIQFEQRAKQAGAKIRRGNSHMLFLGNPGTGKTMIARIITQELYDAGVILENKLLEVERKDLVGEYLGQTAPKTADVIERAMGGVLFIDEAYSLVVKGAGGADYGKEAIATLIKAMEDHKDEFVVIFAGYKKEMGEFLEVNAGIASRVGYTFTFEDYNADELVEIFKLKIKLNGMQCADAAAVKLKETMQYFVSVPNFGNGRFAERMVNVAMEMHAERMAATGMDNSTVPDDLLLLTEEDIPTVKHMLDIMPDGENMIHPDNITEKQNERTAIHELGHALLVKLLTPESRIERITIAAEGSGALGYVRHKASPSYTHTRTELKNIICVKMAGIAAEEVFLGEYANGGTSDIEGATAIATNMILRFGMSETGFASFGELDETGKKEVNSILAQQFNMAKNRIGEYKDKMQEAKEFLLKNKSITDEEFSSIVGIGEKENSK